MKLRFDPWDPEYGGSVELEQERRPPAGLLLDVEEAGAWSPIRSRLRAELPCCGFVDGVRRIDARLFAEDGGVEAPALAGSWAVGCAWSTRPPRIGEIVVGRELVAGAGLRPQRLELAIGAHPLRFEGRSVQGATPIDPIQGLQNAMREAEARLAEETLAAGGADLLVSDGPLTYFATGPAVGIVKRQSRSYLDPARAAVLGALEPGERSPIFKLGEQRLERYSWYLRLAAQRAIDGAMAGIVRLEVAARDGLDAAREIADLTAVVLPRFAPRLGRDPRAPQNLFPVGALESTLRHRLGDAALVRRALEVRIRSEVLRGGRPPRRRAARARAQARGLNPPRGLGPPGSCAHDPPPPAAATVTTHPAPP